MSLEVVTKLAVFGEVRPDNEGDMHLRDSPAVWPITLGEEFCGEFTPKSQRVGFV